MNNLFVDCGQAGSNDWVAGVNRYFTFVAKESNEVVNVVGIHPGGAGGQQTRNVLDADNGHVVFLLGGAGRGNLAVTALVDGNINND